MPDKRRVAGFPGIDFCGVRAQIRKGALTVESNDDALQQLVNQVHSQVKCSLPPSFLPSGKITKDIDERQNVI